MTKQSKTPGVYVKEGNAFGTSIVANPTAIPVFIGFTEKAVDVHGKPLSFIKGSDHVRGPVKITSMLEYSSQFGGSDTTGTMAVTEEGEEGSHHYTAQVVKGEDAEGHPLPYQPGLMEPAINHFFTNGGDCCYIISIGAYADYSPSDHSPVDFTFLTKALEMAEECTLIVPSDLTRYGQEAYYNWGNQFIDYCNTTKLQFCILDVIMADPTSPTLNMDDPQSYRDGIVADNLKYAAAYYPYLNSQTPYAYKQDQVTLDGKALGSYPESTIQQVTSFLATNYMPLPSSPFMAGIYSRVDNDTGVWNNTGNVAPLGISGPVVNLTDMQQVDFNVDPTTGKSINAIRSFTGKGPLVWGARTNDGNSHDWRYINVVRLCIALENDISKALKAFVFKPNSHKTWVEAKAMVESYLMGLFGEGAFAGTTPENSFQVLIGLGETMTQEDVLNGFMVMTIKVAPVRPAEFIVLTFRQMMG